MHHVETDIELKPAQVTILAMTVGILVANIYYIQPLLALIARDFGVSATRVGAVAMLSQLGTAGGMLLFVPLGDTQERHSLILRLILASGVCVVLFATAQNFAWLALAGLGVGMTASAVHVVIPYAAHLAPEQGRGKIVGRVLSGLLLGILLARTFSGLLADWLGWRPVFWCAAGFMALIATLFAWRLPKSGPVVHLTWLQLMKSAGRLVADFPALREAALTGAMLFGSFSAFWTALVFFLGRSPYHYGSGAAGLFGLVGAVGALGAPLIGQFADRHGARRNVLLAMVTTLTSFMVLYAVGRNLWGLIVGVILLDLGVQAGHVSNQTRIYALLPEARSRLNMVYMICYFLAGAFGSFAGSLLWTRFAWTGVCGLGIAFNCAGIAAYSFTGRELEHKTATA